jgi:hypothetical protein
MTNHNPLEIEVRETSKIICGVRVKFYKGIPKDAEFTFSNHLRTGSWDLIPFAYFHELGFLPNHQGPNFAEAARCYTHLFNTTSCWVERYSGEKPGIPQIDRVCSQLDNRVSSERLMGRMIKIMGDDLTGFRQGKSPAVTQEIVYEILGKLDASAKKKGPIAFDIKYQARAEEADGIKEVERTLGVPIFRSITQNLTNQDRLREETELLRKISYQETADAYLHMLGEKPDFQGYPFLEAKRQHADIIDATHYLIEAPLEKSQSLECRAKLADLTDKKEQEGEMIEAMRKDIEANSWKSVKETPQQ